MGEQQQQQQQQQQQSEDDKDIQHDASMASSPPAPTPTALADSNDNPPVPHHHHHHHHKKRRRTGSTNEFPVKDAVCVYIPLDVTADLGIAIRRTRIKRLKKLRRLYPDIIRPFTKQQQQQGKEQLADHPEQEAGEEKEEEEAADADVDEEEDEMGSKKTGVAKNGKGGEDEGKKTKREMTKEEDDDDLLLMEGTGNFIPKREQYGSVLDYLEAKYVRGVMIPDLDEKLRQKKKKKKKKSHKKKTKQGDDDQTIGSKNKDDVEDSLSELSHSDDEGAGSVYSESSFLDDSLLRKEVVEQVMASSAFRKTKIEAEARKAKKEMRKMKKQRQRLENENAEEAADENGGEGESSVEDDEDDYYNDDDDAFFVNVGDLEMDEEDDDVDMAEIDYEELEKSAKGKDKGKNKKKKKTPSKAGKEDTASSSANKDQQSKPGAISLKGKKGDKTTGAKVKSIKKKGKKLSSPIVVSSADVESSIKVKKEDSDEKSSSSSSSSSSEEEEEEVITPEIQAKIDALKAKSEEFQKQVKKLYHKCVEAIKKMTEKHLPRKPKGMIKVSVIVPPKKKAGDDITFSNPHVPGQKLRVKAPKNAQPGGTFMVSVPAPDTRKNKSTVNRISREAQEFLDQYSQAYDDWCQAESEYCEFALPLKGKKNKFKQGTQRLRKFDEMLKEFPTDLATPIDAVFLRKVVRRARQNAKKRMQTAEAAKLFTTIDDDDDEGLPETIDVRVPGTGTHFPTVKFNPNDFVRGDIKS